MFDAVFQLVVKQIELNYDAVWKTGYLNQLVGSGIAVSIDGVKYILTNQHCVNGAIYIECRKNFSDRVFVLNVLDSSPELDLALLTPDQENDNSDIWDGITCVNLGETPMRGDSVYVVGFPQGGRNASITTGIVSRLTTMLYNTAISNIAVQIDAAINPGNSGGPVYNEKMELVGVAFAHREGFQNVCFMIPIEIVKHFLNGFHKFGKFPGVCDLDLDMGHLDNPAIRGYLLAGSSYKSGGIVNRVHPFGATAGILEPEDVLCKIDDHIVGNDASVLFSGERVPYWHLLRMRYPGDQINLTIVRRGETITTSIIAGKMPRRLVPMLDGHISRDYYIFGGLVFMPLHMPYLLREGRLDVEKAHLIKYATQYPTCRDEQVVILKEVVTSPITMGYNYSNLRLFKVDGKVVKNVRHLAELCESGSSNEFIKFELEDNRIIIIKRREGLAISRSIAQNYFGVPYHNLGNAFHLP